ncbi:Ada metal-binding domain-containing protein [Pedobacter aquatilis]|uniref:Ada metal-binding domain-containing protein n=1 Tax=Pedobacter aquatilis TaxID=351343 RepID=UPI00292EC0BC|nr:Ada metal-binding domain-containing protein [Pedobacter aquatilis]
MFNVLKHSELTQLILKSKIRNKEICFGGNLRLKIYGKLSCKSGQRMKPENRVFFKTEKEALENGYRPCGHCLKMKYKGWIYLTRK